MAVGLTLKQQRFVQALPTAKSAKAAAIDAGYAPERAVVTASENVRKCNVALAIAEEQAKVESQVQMTRQEWEKRLQREADGGNLDDPNNARITALRTLGEACGWLKRDVVIN